MQSRIDLVADLGEGFGDRCMGDDGAMLEIVSSGRTWPAASTPATRASWTPPPGPAPRGPARTAGRSGLSSCRLRHGGVRRRRGRRPRTCGGVSLQLRNDMLGHRVRVTEICPGRVETEIFGRNLGGTPDDLKRAWEEFYEHYESVTTSDIAAAARFALETPEHVNVGLIEIMPTLQVPGGLTFNQSR